jgi:hypothetical protein
VGRDLELPPVISPTFLGEDLRGAKDRVERLRKLEARRQRMFACAWTIAGAAPAARTPAMPVLWMNERRCMNFSCDSQVSERAEF